MSSPLPAEEGCKLYCYEAKPSPVGVSPKVKRDGGTPPGARGAAARGRTEARVDVPFRPRGRGRSKSLLRKFTPYSRIRA